MLRFAKLSQQAIAAATYLAERYGDGSARVSASDIADARELPRALVAKVLAALSQRGLVSGAPGPSGGYALARSPEEISLYDLVEVFEKMDVRPMCPFGPNWCGVGPHCPLHEAIAVTALRVEEFLRRHHLGAFRGEGAAGPSTRGSAEAGERDAAREPQNSRRSRRTRERAPTMKCSNAINPEEKPPE